MSSYIFAQMVILPDATIRMFLDKLKKGLAEKGKQR